MQDTGMLLHELRAIWQQVPNFRLGAWALRSQLWPPQETRQLDLLDRPKNAKLVRATDEVNEKFGKGTLIYADATSDQTSKIAFQ